MTTPRGLRNRNPGNLVVSGWTQRQSGYLGPEPEGRFARFATMSDGVAALLRLLLVYRDQHKLKTVRGIINRWAPPVENDTGSYVMSVAKAIGVGIDDELPADADTYIRLARAIAAHENGREASAAVTDQDYADAAASVFLMQTAGTATPQTPPPSAAAPSAPITEKVMAIPALVTAAASALLPLVVDLFRARGSKTGDRNADIVEAAAPTLISIAREVAGKGNEQQVAEAILADKDLQAQFRAAVALRWADVEPFFRAEEESRDKARGFAEQMTGTGPQWRQIGAGVLLAVLSLVIVGGTGYVFYEVLFADASRFSGSTRDGIVEVLKNILILVVGFFFGSSVSGRASGQTVSEIAKQK